MIKVATPIYFLSNQAEIIIKKSMKKNKETYALRKSARETREFQPREEYKST